MAENELEKFLREHPPKPFKPHVWWRPQEGLVEVALEDVSCYHEWIPGEGGDISLWHANDSTKRVVGATLPFTWPLRMAEPARSHGGREEQLEAVLRQIINDLPSKRDWLDPQVERQARNLLTESQEKDEKIS